MVGVKDDCHVNNAIMASVYISVDALKQLKHCINFDICSLRHILLYIIAIQMLFINCLIICNSLDWTGLFPCVGNRMIW